MDQAAVRIECRGARVTAGRLVAGRGARARGGRAPACRSRESSAPDDACPVAFRARDRATMPKRGCCAPSPLDVLRAADRASLSRSERRAFHLRWSGSSPSTRSTCSKTCPPTRRTRWDFPIIVFWLAELLIVFEPGPSRALLVHRLRLGRCRRRRARLLRCRRAARARWSSAAPAAVPLPPAAGRRHRASPSRASTLTTRPMARSSRACKRAHRGRRHLPDRAVADLPRCRAPTRCGPIAASARARSQPLSILRRRRRTMSCSAPRPKRR